MLYQLRQAKTLARFVLVWFALSIGVAMASPIVNPQDMQLVCSGTGVMKVLVQTDEGVKEVNSPVLDCPLCAPMSAPPVHTLAVVTVPHSLSYALQSIPAARIAALTGAPLPARGPPAIL